jgi:hypothetical protein
LLQASLVCDYFFGEEKRGTFRTHPDKPRPTEPSSAWQAQQRNLWMLPEDIPVQNVAALIFQYLSGYAALI